MRKGGDDAEAFDSAERLLDGDRLKPPEGEGGPTTTHEYDKDNGNGNGGGNGGGY